MNDNSYFITGSFSGTATFGEYTVTARRKMDVYLARFTAEGACLGVDQIPGGHGTSVASDGTAVYLTGIFCPYPTYKDSITIGKTTYQSRGYEDAFFTKRSMITGIGRPADDAEADALVIYANPGSGSFRVKVPEAFASRPGLVLTIFDANGRMIHQQKLSLAEEQPKIGLYDRPAGMYAVTLSDGEITCRGKLILK